MGRSRATFLLPSGSRPEVIRIATAFAAEKGLKIIAATPNHVHLSKGSEAVTFRRDIFLDVQDTPTGVVVMIEGWLAGWDGDQHVNPKAIQGRAFRKKAWKLVDELCRRLGVPDPLSIFQHT